MSDAIRPTITAYSPEEYDEQLALITSFSSHIHVDIADKSFTAYKSIPVNHIHWPTRTHVDVHLMSTQPELYFDHILRLKPHLVIFHAEAVMQPEEVIQRLHAHDVRAGVALLQGTNVETITHLLPEIDHVLVFSGSLGSHGGVADLSLLKKVQLLKTLAPHLEIGWDGGVSLENCSTLIGAGVHVLNVGGAIHKASLPHNAYRQLVSAVAK